MKNKKKQNVIYILDRSGSMSSVITDMIGGINTSIKQLKEDEEVESLVTIVLFDEGYQLVCLKESANSVSELSPDKVFARGTTSLYDAIGKTLNLFSNLNLGKNEIPPVVLIYTDGMENSSKSFSLNEVNKTISNLTEKDWVFNYSGSDHDAWTQSNKLGIGAQNTISLKKEHINASFDVFISKLSSYRQVGSRGLMSYNEEDTARLNR